MVQEISFDDDRDNDRDQKTKRTATITKGTREDKSQETIYISRKVSEAKQFC